MLREFRIFGYSEDTDYKAGVEAIYIVEKSEIITRYESKVFQQKFLNLVKSDIVYKDGFYKFKVKRLNTLDYKRYLELEDFIDFAMWELGNTPTHNICDVKELIETHGSNLIKNIFRPIIVKATEMQSLLRYTEIYIDLQVENFGIDEDGKIIGFDAIHITKDIFKEDEKIISNFIFS